MWMPLKSQKEPTSPNYHSERIVKLGSSKVNNTIDSYYDSDTTIKNQLDETIKLDQNKVKQKSQNDILKSPSPPLPLNGSSSQQSKLHKTSKKFENSTNDVKLPKNRVRFDPQV